jgi:hypothetical protein
MELIQSKGNTRIVALSESIKEEGSGVNTARNSYPFP